MISRSESLSDVLAGDGVALRRVEWSDWDERHGRESREAAVTEMGIDRIQSLNR